MAPKPEEYKSNAYKCIVINTADLRNISGDMGKAERQGTFALVTVTEKNRARIEYMRGTSHVSCDCVCMNGLHVVDGTRFALPMWPTWTKAMGVEWVAFLPDDHALGVWCFDKDKLIMACTYELPTKPWTEVAKGLPEHESLVPSGECEKLRKQLDEEVAKGNQLVALIEEMNAEMRRLEQSVAESGGTESVEPVESEPVEAPEPNMVMEPVETGLTHAVAYYVPDGCVAHAPNSLGNVWLEGPIEVTDANKKALEADGWKLAKQRRRRHDTQQWWRKAA